MNYVPALKLSTKLLHKVKQTMHVLRMMAGFSNETWLDFRITKTTSEIMPLKTRLKVSAMSNTEKIATNKIESVLEFCEHLNACINTADKYPSFDGEVDIQPQFPKKNGLCLVRVQVKGHRVKKREDLEKESITYSAEVIDLENYNRNGGVLFFVVNYFERECKAYYCSLVPVKLKRLLKEAGGQKNKSISLFAMPDDPNDVEELFINHYEHSSRQMSFHSAELPEADFLALPPGSWYALHHTSIAQNEQEALSHLVGKESYLYLESPNFPIPTPTQAEITVSAIEKIRKAKVAVGGVDFYDQITLPISPENLVVKIGCLTCTFPITKDEGLASYTFTLEGTFRERLHALRFMKSLIDNDGIEIDGQFIQIHSEDACSKFIESGMQDWLNFLEDVESVLYTLKDDSDFEIPSISEKEFRDLRTLKRGLVDGERLHLSDVGYTYAICHASLFGRDYLILRHTSEDGLSELYNYDSFESETIVTNPETGISSKITKYGPVNTDDLMKVSNLSPFSLSRSCIDAGINNANCQISSNIALALLDRFDRNGCEDDLHASESIFSWLSDNSYDTEPPIYSINLMQIKWRKGELDDGDFSMMKRVLETESILPKKDRIFTVACLALQGKSKEAKTALKALSKANRKSIIKHPIERVLNGQARKLTRKS